MRAFVRSTDCDYDKCDQCTETSFRYSEALLNICRLFAKLTQSSSVSQNHRLHPSYERIVDRHFHAAAPQSFWCISRISLLRLVLEHSSRWIPLHQRNLKEARWRMLAPFHSRLSTDIERAREIRTSEMNVEIESHSSVPGSTRVIGIRSDMSWSLAPEYAHGMVCSMIYVSCHGASPFSSNLEASWLAIFGFQLHIIVSRIGVTLVSQTHPDDLAGPQCSNLENPRLVFPAVSGYRERVNCGTCQLTCEYARGLCWVCAQEPCWRTLPRLRKSPSYLKARWCMHLIKRLQTGFPKRWPVPVETEKLLRFGCCSTEGGYQVPGMVHRGRRD